MKTVLVTGGAGFIGSYVVEALVRCEMTVRVLDNFSTATGAHLARVRDAIEIIEGDIRDSGIVATAIQGVDAVVHLAAITGVQRSIADPRLTHEVNVTGTLNILVAARAEGVERVVMASSAAVYGNPHIVPIPETALLAPLSPYGASKVAMEQYGAVFTAVYGLSVICLRYFNVYGPRQTPKSDYAAVIPAFLERMQRGEPPVIYGDGYQSRDFIHVTDVAEATCTALVAPNDIAGAFNVGTGHGTTLSGLVAALNHHLGSSLIPVFAPPKTGDIRDSVADVSRIKHVLSWFVSSNTPMVFPLDTP